MHITPRNVLVVSSLVVAVFEKHCELKWPLRLHLKQVAFFAGHLSGLWSLPHRLHNCFSGGSLLLWGAFEVNFELLVPPALY